MVPLEETVSSGDTERRSLWIHIQMDTELSTINQTDLILKTPSISAAYWALEYAQGVAVFASAVARELLHCVVYIYST